MIVRVWRGWIRPEDAEAYTDYVECTGMAAYRATPGNRGAWILRRQDEDRVEFVTLSFWDSLDAVRAFAGEPVDRAVFYAEDDRFLVDRETSVTHFEALGGPAPGSRDRDTASREPPP
jgi:heme-degrading monooxygenase HmoA